MVFTTPLTKRVDFAKKNSFYNSTKFTLTFRIRASWTKFQKKKVDKISFQFFGRKKFFLPEIAAEKRRYGPRQHAAAWRRRRRLHEH
jgi:hypothetical protein